jgi:hypothetical protein
MSIPTPEGRYIAALWEHPSLCVAMFGVQFTTEEAARLYDEAGIAPEMEAALQAAEGLLLVRGFEEGNGGTMLQYWRSYEDLECFARTMPHTRWWRWLVDHRHRGMGFYHEIYQVSTAEAIYDPGTPPIGPAAFCSQIPIEGGEGRSRNRQERFRAAQEGLEPDGAEPARAGGS